MTLETLVKIASQSKWWESPLVIVFLLFTVFLIGIIYIRLQKIPFFDKYESLGAVVSFTVGFGLSIILMFIFVSMQVCA